MIFDATQNGTVTNARIHAGKKASRIKDPKPFPTPEGKSPRRPRTRPAIRVSDLKKLNN